MNMFGGFGSAGVPQNPSEGHKAAILEACIVLP